MFRRRFRDEILSLDPVRDHQRIVYLITCHEFPFDSVRAAELALFRTFAVPGISGLLDHTGEFGLCAAKRYDDTDLLLSELVEHGYDSPRGRAALRRMNQLHGRFRIANADYLYVLSTFVFEPIRWNARFGWRPLTAGEKLALFQFWRAVGRRMGIQNLPRNFAEFVRYNVAFERQHFRYAASNRRVAGATMALFLARLVPRPLRSWGQAMILALMDEPLLAALGYSPPSALLRRLAGALLRMRGRLAAWWPDRRQPMLRTRLPRDVYPDGYRIEGLGPPGH